MRLVKRGLSHAVPSHPGPYLALSALCLGEHVSKTKPDISECGNNRCRSVTAALGTEPSSILTHAEVTRHFTGKMREEGGEQVRDVKNYRKRVRGFGQRTRSRPAGSGNWQLWESGFCPPTETGGPGALSLLMLTFQMNRLPVLDSDTPGLWETRVKGTEERLTIVNFLK